MSKSFAMFGGPYKWGIFLDMIGDQLQIEYSCQLLNEPVVIVYYSPQCGYSTCFDGIHSFWIHWILLRSIYVNPPWQMMCPSNGPSSKLIQHFLGLREQPCSVSRLNAVMTWSTWRCMSLKMAKSLRYTLMNRLISDPRCAFVFFGKYLPCCIAQRTFASRKMFSKGS